MPRLYARGTTGSGDVLLPPRRKKVRAEIRIENTVSDSDDELSDRSFAPPTRSRRYAYNRTQHVASTGQTGGPQSSTEDSEDVSDDEEEEGEESEDDDLDDDSDVPAEVAPSRHSLHGGTGRLLPEEQIGKTQEDIFAVADDESEEEEGKFQYSQLEEIDEDDDDEVEDEQPLFINEQLMLDAEDDYDTYLGRIEGLSAYGFGDDDIDGLPASSSSEREGMLSSPVLRHVHFEADSSHAAHLTQTVAPALLPSALPDPDNLPHALTGIQSDLPQVGVLRVGISGSPLRGDSGTLQDDPYDSDATVESLPPEAQTTNLTCVKRAVSESVEQPSPGPTRQKKGKKRPKNEGPPKGLFDIDPQKPYAILVDKARLEVFVPVSGPNRPQWLSKDLLPSEDGSAADKDEVSSISGLLSETNPSVHSGSGSPERALNEMDVSDSLQLTCEGLHGPISQVATPFLPDLMFDSVALPFDEMIDADFVMGPENEGDLPGAFDIFISYGDDDSDVDDERPASSTSLTDAGPSVFKTPELAYSQMNSSNVTSFRRNADPASAALAHNNVHLPTIPRLHIPETPVQSFSKRGHKRKASDSPYSSPRYDGVTPVQRVIRASKRRKTMD